MVVALAALMTAAAVPAFAVQEPEETRLIADAKHSLEKGDVKTALIQLKNAVKANPSSAEARFELGRLELRTGDFVAAERDLTQARENGTPDPVILPFMASALLAEGKNQQLINAITPCETDANCKADVLALRARAYLAMKNIDAADKESQAAIAANPVSTAGPLTRALVLMRKDDVAGAEQLVDKVIAVNPKLPEALILKADLRRRLGDDDGAIQSYRAALALTPKDPRIHQSLAATLLAKGQDADAKAEVDQVLQAAPNSVMALYLKAVLQVRAHQNAEALDTVRPVQDAIAQIPQGTFLLALIYSTGNNLEEAVDYANRFHNAQPDNLAGSKLLATIDFRLRAFGKVISLLAPVRDRLADDAETLDMLGSAYLAEGQVAEANELLNAAVKAQPENQLARARLAVSEARQDATRDEGIRELESLVKADPKNLQIDLALVSNYIASGKYDQAIATATTMVEHQPTSALPLTIRGSAQLAKGDEAAARADFESALAKDQNYVPAAVYVSELDMVAGNFDHARSLLDGILNRSPGDLRALLQRERIEERAGKPEAALPFLESAITNHQDEVEPRVRMMQLQMSLGNSDKATLAAMDLARTQAGNPAAVDMAGRALFSLGKIDECLALYQKLQAAFPDSPEAHERYGLVLNAAGKTDLAKIAFDRAISADQRYIPAWFNRVMIEQRTAGLEPAMVIAEKARTRNPNEPAAAVLPGDLLMSVGRYTEAETSFRKTFEQKPSSMTANRVYRVLAQKGDHAGAQAFLQQWLAKNPNDAETRLVLADDLLAVGNLRQAQAEYETVMKALPRNASLLNNLAWTYGRLHDPRANDTARQAFGMAPNSPAIMDTYGFLLYTSNDQQKGSDLIKRAYQATPRDPQVAYHMARVLADAKNVSEAKTILKGLIEAKQTFDGDADARKLYSDLGGS
jgi:putative PEP-CTERM system TPR-repeat lipoprotein